MSSETKAFSVLIYDHNFVNKATPFQRTIRSAIQSPDDSSLDVKTILRGKSVSDIEDILLENIKQVIENKNDVLLIAHIAPERKSQDFINRILEKCPAWKGIIVRTSSEGRVSQKNIIDPGKSLLLELQMAHDSYDQAFWSTLVKELMSVYPSVLPDTKAGEESLSVEETIDIISNNDCLYRCFFPGQTNVLVACYLICQSLKFAAETEQYKGNVENFLHNPKLWRCGNQSLVLSEWEKQHLYGGKDMQTKKNENVLKLLDFIFADDEGATPAITLDLINHAYQELHTIFCRKEALK